MSSSINEMPSRSEMVWYLIKPTAHEGPYSYEILFSKYLAQEISLDALIWARGWPDSVEFKKIKELYDSKASAINFEEQLDVIGTEFEQDSDLERDSDLEQGTDLQEIRVNPSEFQKKSYYKIIFASSLFVGILAIALPLAMLDRRPQLERPQSLGLKEFREIKKIFDNTTHRVPLPKMVNSPDFKKISLVDRSPQNCSYSLSFISDEDQNLSHQKIAFSAQAQSNHHWIVFDRFDFREGQRLISGHYEVNLQRTHCSPIGWRQLFEANDKDHELSFKQVFHNGNIEDLNRSLDLLKKKKEKESQRLRLASQDSWREIIEKLRTLSAISMQISEDFKLLLNRKFTWDQRVKTSVDGYTLRYGRFLTEFIDNNSKDFERIAGLDIPMKIELLGQAPMIQGFAQRVGSLSVQVIEKISKKGQIPQRVDLEKWLKDFDSSIKLEISKMEISIKEIEQILTTEVAKEEAPSL